MTAAALALATPVLRNAAGEPPLGADGAAFRPDQGQMFLHPNPSYQSPGTRIGVLELETGQWLSFPFGVEREAFASREAALRSGIAAMVRKARRYMRNKEGEGTHWTEGLGGRVIEWALSLKDEKQALVQVASVPAETPRDHPVTAKTEDGSKLSAPEEINLAANNGNDLGAKTPSEEITPPDTASADDRVIEDSTSAHSGGLNQPIPEVGKPTSGEIASKDSLGITDPIVADLLHGARLRKQFPAKHAISMTTAVVNGQFKNIGTCACGVVMSHAHPDLLDAAIEAHWRRFHYDSMVDGRGIPIKPGDGARIPSDKPKRKRKISDGGVESQTRKEPSADEQSLRADGNVDSLGVAPGPSESQPGAGGQSSAPIASAPSPPVEGADASHPPAPIGAGGSEVSEPSGKQALIVPSSEADPVREAGLHGGSLALVDDDDLEIEWPSYDSFLEDKIVTAPIDGIEISASDLSPQLKPHQRDLVIWAVRGGQRAIFASFGLGKTFMQIEIVRLIIGMVAGNGLIVLPLGVRQEFVRDAEKLGVDFKFIRSNDEITADHRLYLTNYESIRDGKLDPNRFIVASLDESSVLRSYGSKTYQEFLPLFNKVRFRFVATATPSPNRFKELIHYSAFLGVMDSGQALTRFFQRDSEKAGNLTLYPHKEREFWMWVHSWASFLQAPSNLGYSDSGYALPPLAVKYHEVPSNHALAGTERDGQALLFRNAAVGLQSAARERSDTLDVRVSKLVEIVNDYRRATAVSAGLLSEKSRGAVAETARAQQQRLPAPQGGIQSPVQAMERNQPGSLSGADQGISGQECGEGQASQQDLVRKQQGVGIEAAAPSQAEELRPDDGAVRSDADRPEQPLRDLQGDDDAAGLEGADGDGDRSRSSDGQGAGIAVSSLQRGDGNVLRRSAVTHDRSGLADQIVIWCDLNAEQQAIEKALVELGISVSSLYGDQDIEERERLLEEWRDRKTSVFLSKPIMYGAGVNLQQCHTMIFVGISYKFQDLIQAIHRIFRFLQEHPCEVHIIHSEAQREILATLKQKWAQHDEVTANMAEIISRHGLDTLPMRDMLARAIGIKRVEITGENFRAINNDCVAECRTWPDNSIDQIITSIPFANHYEYSANYSDFGHTDDNGHFWGQMDFLTAELLRMLKPGRLACVHVKDRVLFGSVTGEGVPTISPFHAEAIMHYRAHGFQYMGLIHINTDVVRENNQTYRLGWSECCKDGTKMGVGSPEYVILLRKRQSDRTKGYADVPVVKDKESYTRARWQIDAHSFWRSSGNRLLTSEEFATFSAADLAKSFAKITTERVYDYEAHVKIGEDVDRTGTLPATFMAIAPGATQEHTWYDINRMRTLNMHQAAKGRENHLCPLQFDIVDRLIERYSNEGDLVFDPFGGLMTVPYRALLKKRKGAATELSASYFLDGVHYLRMAEEKMAVPEMFDLAAMDAANTPPLGNSGD